APAPANAGSEILRPRFGALANVIPNASIMERIRFAAQSRLLVELSYVRLHGQPRRRTIGPYSLRGSQAGDIALAGFEVEDGHIKMYRVDHIEGAHISDRAFVPRYAIELGPLAMAAPMVTGAGTDSTL